MKPPRRPVAPDRHLASEQLSKDWKFVLDNENTISSEAIKKLVGSDQAAIRFCLPTQILGKLVDPSLDALCLQRGDGSSGRWDPRGFATKVIVPWNRDNQAVLGASGDPYVSNPLRRPRVDHGLDQMSAPGQWGELCKILTEIQDRNEPEWTQEVFLQVLSAMRDRLRDLTFVYIIPPRVSLKQVGNLVDLFLAERSGGDRGLAIAAALFETFKERLGIYQNVRRSMINAADAVTQSVGDLECIGSNGNIVLAVEVKERRIGIADVQIAVAKAREFSVREFLFCTEGIVQSEQNDVESAFASAWASGTNLYHATIADLMRGALPLLGEAGMHDFVAKIGQQLDKFNTQPKHRKAWKLLLDKL